MKKTDRKRRKITKTGEFGSIYTKFENKPKNAIKHLKKKKTGECVKALYREDIGYVDIVWGENNSETNSGYGLKHIIEKHGKEIKYIGFEVEEFIPMAFKMGGVKKAKESYKILIENDLYRIVLLTEWKGRKKTLLLTAFDLTPKQLKRKPKT
ncbi:MAG: hypothetical protein FWE63_00425 [Bacteroidales bacterium]|nr:hypothetical protein [Bacteroidales bacterium]